MNFDNNDLKSVIGDQKSDEIGRNLKITDEVISNDSDEEICNKCLNSSDHMF